MKEIKTVGVIGMGAIGISISYILQQVGLNVIGYKHESRGAETFKRFIENNNITVFNRAKKDNAICKSGFLKIHITSYLQEIVDKSDLILNCCRFPQNSTIYQFSDFQKLILQVKKTPIIMFPGKLGSTWLFGKESIKAGLIGYSPIFATSEVDSTGITVNILDFKSKIPLGHDDTDTRIGVLSFLNKYLKFKEEQNTFVDGGNTLKAALSSPISAINASAICDNAKGLIRSKGKPISREIYRLSEEYSLLFQEVFNEQMMVAEKLDISGIQSLEKWLLNRTKKIQSCGVTKMLEEIYRGKFVTISCKDRRLTESFYALSFFKHFADELNCYTPATNTLLQKLKFIQKSINRNYCSSDMDSFISQVAIAYAQSVISDKLMYEYV